MSPASRRLIIAAALMLLAPFLIALGVGLATAGAVESSIAGYYCQVSGAGAETSPRDGSNLDPAQIGYARIIYTSALVMKLPRDAAVIAIAAAIQDSDLVNLNTTTGAGPVGLFQEPASADWGTAAQLASPFYASAEFYRHLIKVPGWQTIPVGQAAAAAQRTGAAGAYDQWAAFSTALVAALRDRAASRPVGAPGPADFGPSIVAWAELQLGVPFQPGGGSDSGPTAGSVSGGTGPPGWDCSGLTMYAVHQATSGKVSLPHSVTGQFTSPHIQLVGYGQLQPGDLVFFTGAAGTAFSRGAKRI